ncbi:protein tyrosine kinase [Dictyocaulus viviparus]|uniref:Protein tyrosine kinase n=1 Tax=Dictyocaulus viviparus TaxID=29172 RepID=A0A0D8XW96_DICVI|nr:protein tyrosine kinase [Dictyocaulus viviparus]
MSACHAHCVDFSSAGERPNVCHQIMLLMLFLTVHTESCEIQTNLSLAVCRDLQSYHNFSDMTKFLHTLRLEHCSLSLSTTISTAVETLDVQCTDTISPFIFENFTHVSNIILSKCELSEIKWQSLYVNAITPTIDVSECPLDCSCINGWLSSEHYPAAYSVIPVLPKTYHCSYSDCIWGTLTTVPYIESVPGDAVTIDVNISAPTFEFFANKKYFVWHMAHPENNVTEYFTRDRVQLEIDVVSEKQLGTIVVVCWHCKLPLMTTIEFRVRVPVRARLEDRGDSHLIIISGWPIVPINLTVERNSVAETKTLSDDDAVIFFDSLVLRPDKGQLLFYRRVFSMFTLACSTCPVDHPTGNYSFKICSTINCFQFHNYINHVENNLIFIRKSINRSNIGSRRTSRVTEETLLRLEERSSLSSSDYSGQVIPFINLGSIQIHECIGKGEFGEVYCGSWQKTGERSVAIKTIKADEDVEKEAVVLSRLEHPNIVRLYGMTRDGPQLLLVFERMNLGDLRTYLRARAPTSSSYSQFPPALVENELIVIVRQIVSGLCYLTTQQIVHRDLAARNCLVSGESDLRCCLASQRPPITVKISDFGMSRRLYGQADYYRMQNHCLLPVRWLPPESITDHKFSASSDIWALGVTMWEVFSYGEVPFAELNNFEMVSCAMAGMY